MRKQDVIDHFGDGPKTAEALEITKQAVQGWGEIVPRGIAYEVEVITDGKLRVDRSVYRELKAAKKRQAGEAVPV